MLAISVGAVVLMVVVNVIMYIMSPDAEVAGRGIVRRVIRHVPLQPVKIVIVSWQILTQVSTC